MDAPTGPRPSRELSPRQREVAALIAAGKTNGEIAEELGISLQGAKYHVSELLRALDLDTREEVAEWWRQQRGLRARFAVTARWTRMPALMKWGLGGAAAAGVAVVAVFALGLAAGSDDENGDGGLSEGAWVVVGVPRGEFTSETNFPDVVFDVLLIGNDSERAVADVTGAAIPAFSPDGGRIVINTDDGTIHMVNTVTGETTQHEETGAMPFGQPVWSPGGTRLLVASGAFGLPDSGLTVLTRTGEVHSSVQSEEWQQGLEPVLRDPDLGFRPVRSRWLSDSSFEMWFVEFDDAGPGVPDWTRGYVATATLGAPGELSWEYAAADATWILEVLEQESHPQPAWVSDSGQYPGAMNAGNVNTIREDVRAALIRYRDDGGLPILPQYQDSPDNKLAIVAEVDGELQEFALDVDPSWTAEFPRMAWDIIVVD